MAGKLPKALLTHCLEQGGRRVDGERALEVMPPGRQRLAALLPLVSMV